MAEVLRPSLDTMDPLTSSLSPSSAAPAEHTCTPSQATTYPASSLSHIARAATTVAGGGVNSRPASQHDPPIQNSQGSTVSTSSFTGKPPDLFPSSSNVSTITVQSTDTDLASPTSPERLDSISKQAIDVRRMQTQRPHTPGVGNDTGSEQMSSTSTSPMSNNTSYLNKGTKRTASGTIKSVVNMQSGTETASSKGAASPKEIAQVNIPQPLSVIPIPP